MIATLAAIGGILLGLVAGAWAGWQWRGAAPDIEDARDYDEETWAETAAVLGVPLHDYTPRGEAL